MASKILHDLSLTLSLHFISFFLTLFQAHQIPWSSHTQGMLLPQDNCTVFYGQLETLVPPKKFQKQKETIKNNFVRTLEDTKRFTATK